MFGLTMPTPLVGRSDELSHLRAMVDAIGAGGGGRVVFVAGQAGVGKTRLAHELADYVRAHQGVFAEGHYLIEGNAPYGPWVQALRTALHLIGDADARALLESYRTDLARLLPELGRASSAASALAPDEQRRRLYDSVAEVVHAISQRQPLVLLLDDVQWAPGLTLVAHVSRVLPRSRALLLCCYREDEFNRQPRLVQSWAELNRSRLSETLRLEPFNPEQTVQMLAHHIGSEVAGQLGARVHKRAGGNAYFTEEVLQTLLETGVIRRVAQGWGMADGPDVAIPESMKLAILERVDRHGEVMRKVLTHAAVLGQEFRFEILRTWTALAEDELVPAIEAAIAARLLVDRSVPGEERYAFADDQIQEVLYAAIPPPTRRRLHHQAALLLRERLAGRPDPPVEQLARHFIESPDAASAAEYAALAGRKSASLFNWAYAVHFYDQALDALTHLPDSPENQRKRVDLTIDRISVSFGVDPAGNVRRLQQALALVPSQDSFYASALTRTEDRLRLGQILYWLGRSHVFRNEMEQARNYLQQSRAVIEPTGNTQMLAIPTSAMGRLSHAQGRFGECVSLLTEILNSLEESANWPEWIASQGYLGAALAAQADYPQGLSAAEQALARAHAVTSLTGVTVAHVCLACVHLHGNDMQRMLVACRDAVQAAHQSGDRLFLYQALVLRGWAESRLGDHIAASGSMQRAAELLTALGGQALFADWHAAASAEIALNAGDLQSARDRALRALEIARSMQGLFSAGIAHRTLARALQASRPAEAEEHLQAGRQAFEAGGAVAELERTRQHVEPGKAVSTSEYPDGLTAREIEVLRLLALGRTNREIAGELVISPTTMDRHISNIYTKIGAHGRAEAATYALGHGFVQRR